MAQGPQRNRRKGETVVSYKGAKFDPAKVSKPPTVRMATTSDIDTLLASEEGTIADLEEEQNVWDYFANIAMDIYETEQRERRMHNAFHEIGSQKSNRRRASWLASMRYPPSYPPM